MIKLWTSIAIYKLDLQWSNVFGHWSKNQQPRKFWGLHCNSKQLRVYQSLRAKLQIFLTCGRSIDWKSIECHNIDWKEDQPKWSTIPRAQGRPIDCDKCERVDKKSMDYNKVDRSWIDRYRINPSTKPRVSNLTEAWSTIRASTNIGLTIFGLTALGRKILILFIHSFMQITTNQT